MGLDRIAALIDEFGAKAYRDGKQNIEKFWALLGTRLAESIFGDSTQTREAIWLFDLDPEIMYKQIMEQMLALKPEDRAEVFNALRTIVDEEQTIGKKTPEGADVIRRVLEQVETNIKTVAEPEQERPQ